MPVPPSTVAELRAALGPHDALEVHPRTDGTVDVVLYARTVELAERCVAWGLDPVERPVPPLTPLGHLTFRVRVPAPRAPE